MRIRPVIVVSALAGGLALGWGLQTHKPEATLDVASGPIATQTRKEPAIRFEVQRPLAQQPTTPPPTGSDTVAFDTDIRAKFTEKAREFFAQAAALPVEERQRRAQEIERELSILEVAGGLSAGETFLVRTGLIRETVTDPAQQAMQLKALQERYRNESSRRLAQTGARPDPAFESYKIRESQIVAEVMSLQEIPDGLTRDEYLRRRLQAAREQLLSDPAP
jgi:hypothetical protein